MKSYCKNCKNRFNTRLCDAIINEDNYNEFVGGFEHEVIYIGNKMFDYNSEGDCKYYKPKYITKIKTIIKKIFRIKES